VYVELKEMLKQKPPLLEDDEDEEAAAKRKAPPTAMDEIARKIIQGLRKPPPQDRRLSANLVHKAWELAYELMEFAKGKAPEQKKEEAEKQLTPQQKKAEEEERANRAKKHGDERMWEVIQGVWVEMLCFSAGRCRGYLHARTLAKGGEYLSYVWLLLSYMGMETMAERMQRTELRPVEGDVGALVKTWDPEEDDDDDDQAAQARLSVTPNAATTSSVVAPAAVAVSLAAVVPVLGDDNV
jgi:hypothetical protein